MDWFLRRRWYEQQITGDCPACGQDIDDSVEGRGARDIDWFRCERCDRAIGQAREERAESRLERPPRCAVCQSEQVYWHTSRPDWAEVERARPEAWTTKERAPCPGCGQPVELEVATHRSPYLHGMSCVVAVVSLVAGGLFFVLALPFLLVIVWPVLKMGRILRAVAAGRCWRCVDVSSAGGFPVAPEDGWGFTRRCPRCGTYFYRDEMGRQTNFARLTPEEARRIFESSKEPSMNDTGSP